MKTNLPIDHNASVNEAEIILGIKKTKLYELLKTPSAKFPRPFKIGRRTFFSAAEIAQWIADQPRVPAPTISDAEVHPATHPVKG